MKFKLTRKNISNILFVLAVLMLLYSPTREWFMRQIAFSPSVDTVEESKKLTTYNWDLKGLNTPTINFNTLENKVIFVNFWATWCPPCRAEMPMIQKLYNDYKNKVAFIFVTNENWETVNSFFSKNNYNLPTYNSLNTPPQLFLQTNSIPATYLIDKKGNVRISKVGAADWDSNKVRNFLDELIAEN
jgi:thiol-disulfide isomerase/thioredoxin